MATVESGTERRQRLESDLAERSAVMTGKKTAPERNPVDEVIGGDEGGSRFERAVGEAREEQHGRLLNHARRVLRTQVGDDPFPEATLMRLVGPELSELDAQKLVAELQRESGRE